MRALQRMRHGRKKAPAAAGKRWTREETDQLRHLVRCGWSVRRIAGVLNRGMDSIYKKALREAGGIAELRRGLFAVRNARETAHLLGISESALLLAIRYGWLRAHRNYGRLGRRAQGLTFLIGDEALEEFLARREAWTIWSPEQIADEDWRYHAEQVRAKAGGIWLSVPALADKLHIGERAAQYYMRRWKRTGEREVIRAASRWYVWEGEDHAGTDGVDYR